MEDSVLVLRLVVVGVGLTVCISIRFNGFSVVLGGLCLWYRHQFRLGQRLC